MADLENKNRILAVKESIEFSSFGFRPERKRQNPFPLKPELVKIVESSELFFEKSFDNFFDSEEPKFVRYRKNFFF